MKEKPKDKIKEPFNPHQTPAPPQIIDPSTREERNEPDKPIENRKSKPENKEASKQGKGKTEFKGKAKA
jgi:hypothetical protein